MFKSFFLLIVMLLSFHAFATPQIKEVDLEEVFVVKKGYDSNDNIEVTFLAKLPSACFSPGHYNLTQLSGNEFRLSFFIKKKGISSCAGEEKIQLKNPVYYSKTISLGELAAGEYKITFADQTKLRTKSFRVTKALANTLDDMEYAPVSNAFIPELVYTTSDAQVILSGIITTTCMDIFDEDIKVTRQGDVFVIIPKAQTIENPLCQKTEIPLQKIISLGSLKKPGSYLIHIRSQSGLSVNKVFQVRSKTFDPTGR